MSTLFIRLCGQNKGEVTWLLLGQSGWIILLGDNPKAPILTQELQMNMGKVCQVKDRKTDFSSPFVFSMSDPNCIVLLTYTSLAIFFFIFSMVDGEASHSKIKFTYKFIKVFNGVDV